MLKIGITGSVLAIILLAGIHFSERQVERETIGQEESADAVDDTRPRAARVLDIVAQDSSLEGAEIEFLLARSALLRRKMAQFSSDRGVEENEGESEEESSEELGRAIRNELRDVWVSRAQAEAYFDANRMVFGDRSFEESQHVIHRLVQLDEMEARFSM
jgi:hypothetical protein